MAMSFSTFQPLSKPTQNRRKVLVTGAAGNIGSYFAEHSHERYALRLMVCGADTGVDKLRKFGEVVVGELADIERLNESCRGIDSVVHMAGDPSPSATWNDLLHANIIGTYNILVAAKAAGCRRVIHASSIHAVSGYPADVQVKTSDPINPGDLYGVSKCFGEALARDMAEQASLSCITLPIGAFQPLEAARRTDGMTMLHAFVSQRDMNQLLQRCIDDEKLKFAIFNGLSNNRFKRLDITDARELIGYLPQDDLTEVNPKLNKLGLAEVSVHSQQDGSESGIREEVEKLVDS